MPALAGRLGCVYPNGKTWDTSSRGLHCEFKSMPDRTDTIRRVCETLSAGDAAEARAIIRAEYPFALLTNEGRRYSERESIQVFVRDGFIDRYSGRRLVFPGLLRLLSRLLPEEFPFHSNWKMAETHLAFWELFPTIDHVLPIARGGSDSKENWITTSMLKNAAKANWTLAELGWTLCDSDSCSEWDGLTGLFLEFVEREPSLLEDAYLRRWRNAAIALAKPD